MTTATLNDRPADPSASPATGFLADLDTDGLAQRFAGDDEFLFIDRFLPPETSEQFAARIASLESTVHRNFIPKHKKGGSVSRYTLDELAPEIPALYRNPEFIAWLERLTGESLQVCPDSDPHAYALYFYTEAGDHIGWHFDTSYYAGKRYTLLLGVVDDSSSQLEFELFKHDDTRETLRDARNLRPGAMCFFNGDKVWHRITPLGDGETRISLTFEYVTDPHMGRWQRFVSNMKDSIAYFGFRQVFSRALGRKSAR
ncbi:2OG-Fe(II) oxygenase [Salinisphaera sp. T31B1]|uniref:HalD/BesD family halogenase n=1 Tax=Salinisphaera sp. T31B1 TaxID=727963 RepID=UPI00333FCCB2